MAEKVAYKRVVIKLSGESLLGSQDFGIDAETISSLADQILNLTKYDLEISLVIGAGNIFRGVSGSLSGMDRVTADQMGMLGTVINALALQDALERLGIFTRVMSPLNMEQVCEPYIRRRAIRHMEKGRIVIFSGGTGLPFFSTDTTAALRANEIGADLIIKATRVNGIYNKDPELHDDAVMYERLTYLQVIEERIRVMDHAALSLCSESGIPIIVLNIFDKSNLPSAVLGVKVGTIVEGSD